MARRNREPEQSGSDGGGWINTFADLMNLLLCFFVLLFSMSTVDADKYEALVTSLSASISIFDGGGSMGEGAFVSSGTDQMVSISEYFNEYENGSKNSESSEEDEEAKNVEEYKEQLAEEQKEQTTQMYEEVKDMSDQYKLSDMIDVDMDKSYQYVQISLSGAILFDSGKADIKPKAKPLLQKIGDILTLYDHHLIKIEGHTDNVPITSGTYKSNMWLSTARATEVFEYFTKVKKLDPKTLEASGRSEYNPVAPNTTESGRARNRRVEIKIYSTD